MKCNNVDCPCNQPPCYWVELDKDNCPTGNILFAYYPDDKPLEGKWVKVQETGERT